MLTAPPLASSVVALATTVHLACAALRNHRRMTKAPVSALAAISFALAILPWILPSLAGVVLGLIVHAAWFWICERFVPKPVTAPARAVKTASVGLPAAARAIARPAAAAAPPRAAGLPDFVPVPVLAVIEETPSIKTIRVARPESFEFEPGQFLTVRIKIEGKEYARCYSLSSSPYARGYLEISVRRQGLVSNALHASLRPGAMLSVKGPMGVFKYPSGDDRPLVLLAGGIGITPLISMLRHALSRSRLRPVTLLYSARSEEDFAIHDELMSIGRRHQHMKIHFAL